MSIDHIAIAVAILSEVLSIVQQRKYPKNNGIGGILAGVFNIFKMINNRRK